ncbi:pantothenate transporter liz1 [Pyricularia oryzae Y34]|uniref:Pantothenate transporter liz1 n=2 Tax=Pyricularia oryzae TaxID=318829 RepID=A0AA97PGF0_PYRO3|nr:pantothenate transporter liz1 [Pyricularia oryzae Y34]
MGVGSAIKRNKAVAVIISVFDWYPSDSSAVERKLLRKLDLAILIFGSLSFFCRFLGQQNITNAYVSGMREDLNAFGNELNYYKMALGSWYKNDEVFKRAGVWFMGNSLGSMFSGYLQAAAYKNLNGVMGRAGWRWLFIIHGVITLPISFLGYAVWPGLPISKRRWWMTEEEHALALKRIPVVEKEGITWKTFKYTLSRPMWWICVPTYVCLVLSNYWTTYMALWLRAEKYPIEMVNVLPTFIDLIRAFSSWLGTTLAGTLSLRGLWTFQFTTMFFACLMLSIWNIPNALKFVAFYLSGFSGMASPILYTWVNFTLKENYGERGLIISSMMTMGFSTSIWVPLLIFPAVEAPEWKKGYPASTVFQFLMYSGLMFGSWYMVRWKTRQPDPEREQQQERRHEEEVESAGTRTDDDEKHVGSSSALPAGPAAAVVAPAAAADDQAGRR